MIGRSHLPCLWLLISRGVAREATVASLVDRLMAKHPRLTAVGDDELMTRGRRFCLLAVGWELSPLRCDGSPIRALDGFPVRFTGKIRYFHRLHTVLTWVIDAVLVHELAHLVHPNHSPAFHALADGFPRHREAGKRRLAREMFPFNRL